MAAANALLNGLSDEQRQLVESSLVRFERDWNEGRMAVLAAELPADPAVRRPLLVELAKVDLERQWRSGHQVHLEDYLAAYPELGGADGAPADLIQAECEVRRQFGQAADPADYARRFPRQAEELRRLLEQSPGTRSELLETDVGGGRGERVNAFSTVPSVGPTGSQLPEQFGRYRILRRLGQGGMGSVHLAHDTQLDRPVALKVPTFSAQDDPALLERFYREARAAATLDHPNLCPVYDVGQHDGTPYLTMAYIEGQSLADRLKQGWTPEPAEAAALVRKIALAVGEAHGRGVIHRDLKPSNVMLNRRGEPVVMDFGLARRVKSADVRLTQSGSLIGTPAYMPPEQVAGDVDGVGPASDVYSLGVILYELLTGRLPFDGSLGEVMARVLTEAPPPPSALRPGLDPRLEAICLKAMAKKPADRFASMTELAEALERCLSGRSEPVKGGRRLLVALALAGGLAAVAAVVIVIVIRTRGKDVTVKVEIEEKAREAKDDRPKSAPGPDGKLAEARSLGSFEGAVQSVAFSADGKRATAVVREGSSTPHTLHLWDLKTGKEQADKRRKYLCGWMNLAADGKRLAGSGSGGPDLFVADAESGEVMRNFETRVWIGRLSRDGQRLVTHRIRIEKDHANMIQVHDVKSGKQVALRHLRQAILSEVFLVAVSNDGRRAFSASNDKQTQLWDVAKEQGRAVLADLEPRSAEFSGDSKSLLVGDSLGVIRLLSADDGKEIRTFEHRHELPVTCVTFSPDGKRAASGSKDKTVRIWDVTTGKEVQCLTGHEGEVTALAFSADGTRLLSGGADKTVRLWERQEANDRPKASRANEGGEDRPKVVPEGDKAKANLKAAPQPDSKLAEARQMGGFKGPVSTVAFSPDGNRAIAADLGKGGTSTLRIWDLKTGKEQAGSPRNYRGHWMSLTAGGKRLAASGSGLQDMFVADAESGEVLRRFETRVGLGRLSRNGERVVVYKTTNEKGGRADWIQVHDIKSGKQLAAMRHPRRAILSRVFCVALSNDGSRALSASDDKQTRLWDVAKGEGRAVLADLEPRFAEFSDDGKSLLVGDSLGVIRLLSADDGKEIRTFEHRHELPVTCVTFSPDGKRAASGCKDRTVRVWDVASGKEFQRLTGHEGEVTALAFSADGTRLLSGSVDRTVRLWEPARGK